MGWAKGGVGSFSITGPPWQCRASLVGDSERCCTGDVTANSSATSFDPCARGIPALSNGQFQAVGVVRDQSLPFAQRLSGSEPQQRTTSPNAAKI